MKPGPGTRLAAIKMTPVFGRLPETGAPFKVAVTAQHPAMMLVPRTQTERPEGVIAGAAVLIGGGWPAVIENTHRLIDDTQARKEMTVEQSPYGDGQSASRIVDGLANRCLGRSNAFEQAS